MGGGLAFEIRSPAWCLGLALLGLMQAGQAQEPEWIWLPASTGATQEQTAFFRRDFRTPPYTWNARLTATADDGAEFFLNGRLVAECGHWEQPVRVEVSVNLNQGENVLAVRARNASGPAGLLVHLNLGGDRTAVVVSDSSWRGSATGPPGWNTLGFDDRSWLPVTRLGPHGMPPWGDVLFRPHATPAESLHVPAGYAVELLRSARPEEGSWICLAFDDRGRLYLSPEEPRRSLLRVAFNEAGDVARVEPVPAPLGQAMGLLYAHQSLLVNGRGPQGTGLYRLSDTNHNDRFDSEEVTFLKGFSVGGEHGYHALALGPDGMIYVLNGNMTKPPEDSAPDSPLRHYAEDVVSVNPDEMGQVSGIRPPAGYIARTDPEGQHWELVVGGLRNAYGFDFNPDGELFTFDSDNEWNWGTPWYIPTRVLHCVSGADYGWRDGLRIWPEDYPDTLPAVVDVGIGSPCGVKFGTRSRFPARHRQALFVQDWSYGRILAVHLVEHGASYRGRVEEFVRGRPLNLTAMDFGPDGALYFVTGGRGTQSGLYRVRYVGTEPNLSAKTGESSPTGQAKGPESTVAAASGAEGAGAEARALRRRLEAFHGRTDPAAVPMAWPHLGSRDPFLRHAARVAIESQPAATWVPRALDESDPDRALTAALAGARVGGFPRAAELWRALERFPWDGLNPGQQMLKLRVISVSMARGGAESQVLPSTLAAELDRHFPATTWPMNRELTRLLLLLRAPGILPRVMDVMSGSPEFERQLFFVSQLRNLREGWTLDERQRFFAWWHEPRHSGRHHPELPRWFADVDRRYVDGALVGRYLSEMHRDAVATLTEVERTALASVIEWPRAPSVQPEGPPRQFIKSWTVADVLPHLDAVGAGRDYERGRRAFRELECLACHRLADEGGALGPELGGLVSKYTRRDILDSLLEPSKVVSDQYRHQTVFLADGDSLTGRLLAETPEAVVVESNWRTGEQTRIPRAAIAESRPSTLSPMPEALLDVLTLEEILDLLAFLEAEGRPDTPAFGAEP